jgi:hypothetical protein
MKINCSALIRLVFVAASLAISLPVYADGLSCNLSRYSSQTGLSASLAQNTLTVTWDGETNNEMVRRQSGSWPCDPAVGSGLLWRRTQRPSFTLLLVCAVCRRNKLSPF